MREPSARSGLRNLSNWRSVRLWETSLEQDLRRRHSLWLHGLAIGAMVLAVMWGMSHLQMVLGSKSLALRYLVTLGAGYLFYLLLLRLWAASLLSRESSTLDGLGDVPLPDFPAGPAPHGGGGSVQSGGGGDFGGGGASGDFSMDADAGSALGDVAGGALEAVAGADEGVVVVIPVVAIFLVGLAVLFGAGSLLLLYFGWEALLTVAVELAFSYVSGRAAILVVREGWLSAAVRLSWKPLLGALLCAVLLGATLDFFIPAAHSLPQAIQLIKSRP